MFKALFYPREVKFYTDNVGASVTNSMSVYTVNCTVFTVHSGLYTVDCAFYTIHCVLYTVKYTLHTIHCTLYTMNCTLYIVQWILYTLHSTISLCRLGCTVTRQELEEEFSEDNQVASFLEVLDVELKQEAFKSIGKWTLLYPFCTSCYNNCWLCIGPI